MPQGELQISMEFFTSELLMITNRGTWFGASIYVLVNVSSHSVLWTKWNLFEPIMDPQEDFHFVPTLVSRPGGYALLLTNSSGGTNLMHGFSDYGFTSFNNMDVNIIWTFTFTPQEGYPSGSNYKVLQPMGVSTLHGNMFISGITAKSDEKTDPSFLVAVDVGGKLLWRIQFNETIKGYATVPGSESLYVSTAHTLFGINATTVGSKILWSKKVESGYATAISPPTVDVHGSVYVCDNGRLVGYDHAGNGPISVVEDEDNRGNECDQPILLDSAILVRMSSKQNTAIFFAELAGTSPSPPAASPAGLIVGIVIGIIILVGLLVVIVRYRRRRTLRRYEVLN